MEGKGGGAPAASVSTCPSRDMGISLFVWAYGTPSLGVILRRIFCRALPVQPMVEVISVDFIPSSRPPQVEL